jgi:hypothetical protein
MIVPPPEQDRMALQRNTQLEQLKQQMATLKPGVLDNALENAAPFITKALGYAEIIGAVLPQFRSARTLGQTTQQAGTRAAAVVKRWPWSRPWSWRARLVLTAAPVVAALAVYTASRFRIGARLRRRVPPG